MDPNHVSRRKALQLAAGAAGAMAFTKAGRGASGGRSPFVPEYVLSTCMYGGMALADILPEAEKTGAATVDIWPAPHGNQREQVAEMGEEAFARLLEENGLRFGVSTCYKLGPFGLGDEMGFVKRLGGKVLVCGARGPKEPSGEEAKRGVREFIEKMKPHVAQAEETGVTIAVENHDRQLLYHPDAIRYFREFNPSPHLGIAFAPHHLYKFVDEIPHLIRDLGAAMIPFIYFQEHGKGTRKKLPKHEEMMQMPGFGGGLDYRPLLKALADIRFNGLAEIFMHPVPRGIPILPTKEEVTDAINQSRRYIDACLEEVHQGWDGEEGR